MADTKRGTASGARRAELRLLLKRVDAETRDDVVLDINPDDPGLSAEDAAEGIELLRPLADQHENEKKKKEKEKKEHREGCLILLGIAFLVMLVVGWCGSE